MGGNLRGEASAYRPMPRRAEDVTPEWLTTALQSHGRDVVVTTAYDVAHSAKASA